MFLKPFQMRPDLRQRLDPRSWHPGDHRWTDPARRNQPAGEPGQAAITADYTVAGHHDWQRIATIGRPDCPYRRRVADGPGYIPVTAYLTVGNVSQRVPD